MIVSVYLTIKLLHSDGDVSWTTMQTAPSTPAQIQPLGSLVGPLTFQVELAELLHIKELISRHDMQTLCYVGIRLEELISGRMLALPLAALITADVEPFIYIPVDPEVTDLVDLLAGVLRSADIDQAAKRIADAFQKKREREERGNRVGMRQVSR